MFSNSFRQPLVSQRAVSTIQTLVLFASKLVFWVYSIKSNSLKFILLLVKLILVFRGSSMVERRPVKAMVVGSTPTRGAVIVFVLGMA